MKKTIALLLLFVMLFSLAACGEDGTSDVPAGMKLASDPEIVDYYLYVPEDWKVTSQTGMTTAQASLNDDSNVIVTNFTNPEIPPYQKSQFSLLHYCYGMEFLHHFYGEDKTSFVDELEEDDFTYREEFLTYALEHAGDTNEGIFARTIGLFDKVTEDGVTRSSFELIAPPTLTTLKKGEKEVAALTFTYTATLSGRKVKQKMVLAEEDAYFYVITFTASQSIFDRASDAFDAILKNFSFED